MSKKAPRLLIVDDDKMMRRVLSDYAWLLGWSSIAASDGGAGYLAAQNERFDAIVTDCHMPRFGGIEMIGRIRAGTGPNADTPMLVVTGMNNEDTQREAYAAGATAFIVKPVSLDEFRHIVESALSADNGAKAALGSAA